MAEFGELLRKARESKGMTQQSLADQVYVTRQTVSRWESGSRYPDLVLLKKLAVTLDVTTDYLLSNEEMAKVVEKTTVAEKPIVQNLIVVLYALMSFIILSTTGYEFYVLAGNGDLLDLYTLILLIKNLTEAGLFIYGLVLVVKGIFTPKKLAVTVIVYLILETITRFNVSFLTASWDVKMWIIVSVLPYMFGAAGGYAFFIMKKKSPVWQILIWIAALYGIFRQGFETYLMYHSASNYMTGYHVLLAVLRILIFISFLYLTIVVGRRRTIAGELSTEQN